MSEQFFEQHFLQVGPPGYSAQGFQTTIYTTCIRSDLWSLSRGRRPLRLDISYLDNSAIFKSLHACMGMHMAVTHVTNRMAWDGRRLWHPYLHRSCYFFSILDSQVYVRWPWVLPQVDSWHLIVDTWHLTLDTWQSTLDSWQLTVGSSWPLNWLTVNTWHLTVGTFVTFELVDS